MIIKKPCNEETIDNPITNGDAGGSGAAAADIVY
jgi:hypothetical protein